MLFWLTACVLFQSGAIDCAKDEPCVPETGLEETVGEDTEVVDTNPPAADPVVGAWITGQGDAGFLVSEVAPGGLPERLWSGTQILVASGVDDTHLIGVGENGELVDLRTETLLATLPSPTVDLAEVDGQLVFATQTTLYRNKGGVISQISTGSFSDLRRIVADGEGGLYGIELVDGQLRLMRGTSAGWGVELAAYDDRVDRSVDLFLGQGGAPMVCSASGDAYRIAALDEGDTTPWRSPKESVVDVVGCSFDTGSQQLLLLSESAGLLRVDPDGEVTVVALGFRASDVFFAE